MITRGEIVPVSARIRAMAAPAQKPRHGEELGPWVLRTPTAAAVGVAWLATAASK